MSIHATEAETKVILDALRRAKHRAQQSRKPQDVVMNPAGELCIVPCSARSVLIERVYP